MPHILIQGYDRNRNVQQFDIHAAIHFSHDYYHSEKARVKLDEIKQKLEKVVAEYFDDFSSDNFSNHDWNLKMNDH
ncbi:MAG: hypothetical protein ACTHK8_18915 [Ginsengibacter sp.]